MQVDVELKPHIFVEFGKSPSLCRSPVPERFVVLKLPADEFPAALEGQAVLEKLERSRRSRLRLGLASAAAAAVLCPVWLCVALSPKPNHLCKPG